MDAEYQCPRGAIIEPDTPKHCSFRGLHRETMDDMSSLNNPTSSKWRKSNENYKDNTGYAGYSVAFLFSMDASKILFEHPAHWNGAT